MSPWSWLVAAPAGKVEDMPPAGDVAVKVLARQQGGVFTMRQAGDRGLSRQAVQRRIQWGWYERFAHGVYRDVAVPVTARTRNFAALMGVGRDAVLARHTAGEVLGLDATPRSSDVHLLVECTCPHGRDGVVVHRTATLSDHHTTTVDDLPLTTGARTICDLANGCGPMRLRRLVAEAVRRGLTTPDELRRVMQEMGRFRGKAALRDVVDELSPLQAVTRSALESEFLSLTTDAGIEPTAMNHPVVDSRGRQRFIDAVYVPPRLPIELDSRLAHGSLLDWHDDLRRENDIVLEGWLPFLRYSWSDVTTRGHLVVEQIKGVLSRLA